jgi:Phage P22-like portal protein
MPEDYEEKDSADEKPAETGRKKPGKRETERILEESKKRFKLCEEAEKDQRQVSLEDLNFRAGDQWPEAIKQRMLRERKPCLVINVLPATERQILNEQRQNRPSIKVSPVDGQADEDTADVLQGLIRHIEYDSDAESAYDTATASQVRIGFGYVRLITEYESPDSFRQVIKIERIRNAFDVYLDPFAQKADCSDAKHGHIFCTYSKNEYKQEFPDSELSSLDNWMELPQGKDNWLTGDGARIAEYFCIEYENDIALELTNPAGETRNMFKSEYDDLPPKVRKRAKITGQRKTQRPVVHWYKHNAIEILEHEIWLGQWIPIIKFMGDEVDVDGKVTLEGVVRHAKDPMRMQNYMASKEVQAIALAPNAPWVAAEGQTEQHPEWKDANNEMYSVMVYNPVAANGQPVGPPTRSVAEPPIQAITEARMHFADDLKRVTGIYDAQLGAKSNEVSGLAIDQRKTQGQLSNFHFVDNGSRAIKFLGRQLIDLIPKIYTEAQEIRIIGEDGAQKVVQVNQTFLQKDGSPKKYDLTIGRYDVAVSNQPSYQTRRQESAANMLQLTKAYPQLVQIAGDIIVGAMDFPDHERLAERIKKTLPPGLADDPNDTDPKTQLASAQAKLQRLGMQHQQLVTALQHEIQLRETKQVEMNSRKDIEGLKIQGNLAAQKMENDLKIAIAEIQTKAQIASERQAFVGEFEQQMHSQAHDVALAAQQHSQAQDLAAQQAQAAQQQQSTQIGADQQKQSQDQQFQAQQAQQQQESQPAD